MALVHYLSVQRRQRVLVGWIHSHPSQSAYMSAQDCHTTRTVDAERPGALAIVCSLREGEGEEDCMVLSLTDKGRAVVDACDHGTGQHEHEGAADETHGYGVLFETAPHFEYITGDDAPDLFVYDAYDQER